MTIYVNEKYKIVPMARKYVLDTIGKYLTKDPSFEIDYKICDWVVRGHMKMSYYNEHSDFLKSQTYYNLNQFIDWAKKSEYTILSPETIRSIANQEWLYLENTEQLECLLQVKNIESVMSNKITWKDFKKKIEKAKNVEITHNIKPNSKNGNNCVFYVNENSKTKEIPGLFLYKTDFVEYWLVGNESIMTISINKKEK